MSECWDAMSSSHYLWFWLLQQVIPLAACSLLQEYNPSLFSSHIHRPQSYSQHTEWENAGSHATPVCMDVSLKSSLSLNSKQDVSAQDSRLLSPQYIFMFFRTPGLVLIQSAFQKFFSQINMFPELLITLQIKLSLLPDDSCYFCFH